MVYADGRSQCLSEIDHQHRRREYTGRPSQISHPDHCRRQLMADIAFPSPTEENEEQKQDV